jgi:hypothetical protein
MIAILFFVQFPKGSENNMQSHPDFGKRIAPNNMSSAEKQISAVYNSVFCHEKSPDIDFDITISGAKSPIKSVD